MKAKLKTAAWLIFVGIVVGTGVKLIDWLVPSPDKRIVVCFAQDYGIIDECHTLAELKKGMK